MFEQRIAQCTHAMTKRLLTVMQNKKSNLAVAADVTTSQQLLQLADELGPHVCVFKTHVDIIEDFTPSVVQQLRLLADKHQFLIFEDRKFADIGNTVNLQFTKGIYHIADWADIINAHGVPGPGIIDGLRAGADLSRHGLLLLAEMSSQGSLAYGEYSQAVVRMAEQNTDFVMGFIGQRRLTSNPNHIVMTPGISLSEASDGLSQQYKTPREVIIEQGSDIIIVGRSIINAQNPVLEAEKYQKVAWEALKFSIKP